VLSQTDGGELRGVGLTNFAALQSLRELELFGRGVNNEVMPYVCSLTNLESLRIWESSIGEQGIAGLSGLRSLKRLELATIEGVTQRSMETLAKLPEMEFLGVAGEIKEGAFSTLNACPKLHTVAVGGSYVGRLLAELSDAPTIHRVEVSRARVDAAVAERFRGVKNLVSLKLECCEVSPEAVKILSSLNLHQIECVQLKSDVLAGLATGMQVHGGYGNLTVGY
jgi:hypothetical protein